MTKQEAYAEMDLANAEFQVFMRRLSNGEEVNLEFGSKIQERLKAASDAAIAHLHAEQGKAQ